MPGPVSSTGVPVSPSFAATGSEEFYTGADLFEEKPKTPNADEGKMPQFKGTINNQLLVYPVVRVHGILADRTGYEGWRVNEEEKAYWGYLADFAIQNLPMKYLVPIVMLMGLAVIEAGKVAGWMTWQAQQNEAAKVGGGKAPAVPPGAA